MGQQHPLIDEEVERFNRTGRIICPECGPGRQKCYERTLSITEKPGDDGVPSLFYLCHHCAAAGVVKREAFYRQYMDVNKPAPVVQIPTQFNDSTNKIKEFFAARGTPIDTMDDLPPIIIGMKWFRKYQAEAESIGFVYGDGENPEAIKWRPLYDKSFSQTGAAKTFWGLEQLPENPKEIVIVEGEPDVVALKSIGVTAISVPNGAPDKPIKNTTGEDTKFAYLWAAREIIEGADKIILATDGDYPGGLLREELARRIDRAKCWYPEYPEGCKDFTEVIRDHGKDAAKKIIDKVEPMPLSGVYSADEYAAEMNDLYLKGHGKGESTGLASVDDIYTVGEGALTVVTGIPNSGKSEFVDQILVNLAMQSGWRFAVASFENPPATHMSKLAEKIVSKPFYEGVTPRMSRREMEDAQAFINSHFVFLDSKDGAVSTVDSIISRTKQAVMRLGVRGLVIDPYNYIERGADNEHHFISDMLTKIVTFAKAHDIHVWFIAHPKGMLPDRDGNFPIPTGMHISGGPTWFAKADCGITVHRGERGVEIHCWKARLKWIGKQGMVYVDYNVPTGEYRDYPMDTGGLAPISQVTSGRKQFYELDE